MASISVTQELVAGPSPNVPTLLEMRQSPMKSSSMIKRRQAPKPLALPDDPFDLETSEVCVKNTFLEPKEQLSPSLGDFYFERIVQTCPSHHIGSLVDWLNKESEASLDSQETLPMCSEDTKVSDVSTTPVTPPSTQGTDTFVADSMDHHIFDDNPVNVFNCTGDSLFSDGCAPWLQESVQQPQPQPHYRLQQEARIHDQPFRPGPICREGSTAFAELGTWSFSLPVDDNCGFPSVVMSGPLSTHPPPGAEFGFSGSYDPKTTLSLADMLASQQFLRAAAEAPLSSPGDAPENFALSHNPPPVYSPSGLNLQSKNGFSTVDTDAYPKPPAWTPTVSPSKALAAAEDSGSKDHQLGRCKPCAFLHTKGCANGTDCPFCHLCGPEELKRRRKQKLEQRRVAKKSPKDDKSQKGRRGSPNEVADVRGGHEVQYA